MININHLFIANWKMHMLLDEAYDFCYRLSNLLPGKAVDNIIIAVPHLYLLLLQQKFKNLTFAAQNVSEIKQNFGSYTGEVSAYMIRQHNIKYSLIGHLERRKYFNESSVTVNKKIINCLNNNITPIICIGESLVDRQSNEYLNAIAVQLESILDNVLNFDREFIIAYEPHWAIGTDLLPSLTQLEEMCLHIVKTLVRIKPCIEKNIKLVYGGSVNANNINDILAVKSIDGVLIGSSSLDIDKFSKIIQIRGI